MGITQHCHTYKSNAQHYQLWHDIDAYDVGDEKDDGEQDIHKWMEIIGYCVLMEMG